jgi:hypothetical protein
MSGEFWKDFYRGQADAAAGRTSSPNPSPGETEGRKSVGG